MRISKLASLAALSTLLFTGCAVSNPQNNNSYNVETKINDVSYGTTLKVFTNDDSHVTIYLHNKELIEIKKTGFNMNDKDYQIFLPNVKECETSFTIGVNKTVENLCGKFSYQLDKEGGFFVITQLKKTPTTVETRKLNVKVPTTEDVATANHSDVQFTTGYKENTTQAYVGSYTFTSKN